MAAFDGDSVLPLGYWPSINDIYHSSYRQSGLVTFVFSGHGPVDDARLGRSVRVIQRRYPLLSSQLTESEQQTAAHVSVDHPPVYLELLEATDMAPLDLAAKLMQEEVGERLWRAVFARKVVNADAWSFIVLCHHSICDAQSVALLMTRILEHYVASLESDVSHTETEDAQVVDVPPPLSRLTVESIGAKGSSAGPQSSGDWPVETMAPLGDRIAHWVPVPFDPGALGALLQACRRESVSLSSLLTAVLVRAGLANQSARVTTAINFRGRAEPVVGNEDFGCYIGMVEGVIPAEADIWEHAKICALHQFEGFERSLIPRLKKPVLDMLIRQRIESGLESGVFAGGSAITNYGVLETPATLGPLHIDEAHYTSPQLAGLYSLFMSAVTHNDRLYLSLSYAEPLMSPESVDRIAADMARQLEKACRD